jgi:MFS family permease
MPDDIKMPNAMEMQKNRFLGVLEGASARVIFNLTTGAFLVGLLKYIGASDTVCGYIIAIPVLAAVVQFLSPIILESLKMRKKIIIAGCMIHRLLLSSLVAIPFLPADTNLKLWIAVAVFFISYLAVSFINPAVANMYVSFVPQNIRGKYFGMRESYLLLSATIVSLILGKVLDTFEEAGRVGAGYLIIYAVVFVFTIINFISFYLMKEVPLVHNETRMKISEVFSLPLKSKRFVRFFIMSAIWNVAFQIAGAYFSVYLVSDIDMSYTTITLLGMLSSGSYVVAANLWGKLADRRTWPVSAYLSLGALGVCHTLWFLSSKGSPLLLPIMVLAHIISGIAWSGVNISMFNLQFVFTPDEKRTVYIGFNAAAAGILGYMAAVLGSILVGLFGEAPIRLGSLSINIKQVLFAVSATLIFVCVAYIFFFLRDRKAVNEEEAQDYAEKAG